MNDEKKSIEELKKYFENKNSEKMVMTKSVSNAISNITSKPIKSKLSYKFKLAFTFVLLILMSIPFVTNNLNSNHSPKNHTILTTINGSTTTQESNNNQSTLNDDVNQSYTYAVYNAIMNSADNQVINTGYHNEKKTNIINIDISTITDNEEQTTTTNYYDIMPYDKIEIYQSYRFTISLENNEFPYLESITGDKDIEVIVAFFGLSSNSFWYSEQMIIFKGKDGMVGCLGATSYMITSDKEKIPRMLNNLYFGTYLFLGNNSVIKYTDLEIYEFNVDLSNPQDILLTAHGNGSYFDEDYKSTIRYYHSIENSFQDILVMESY